MQTASLLMSSLWIYTKHGQVHLLRLQITSPLKLLIMHPGSLKIKMASIGESQTFYGATGFLAQMPHMGLSLSELPPVPVNYKALAQAVQACHWWHTCAFYSR